MVRGFSAFQDSARVHGETLVSSKVVGEKGILTCSPMLWSMGDFRARSTGFLADSSSSVRKKVWSLWYHLHLVIYIFKGNNDIFLGICSPNSSAFEFFIDRGLGQNWRVLRVNMYMAFIPVALSSVSAVITSSQDGKELFWSPSIGLRHSSSIRRLMLSKEEIWAIPGSTFNKYFSINFGWFSKNFATCCISFFSSLAFTARFGPLRLLSSSIVFRMLSAVFLRDTEKTLNSLYSYLEIYISTKTSSFLSNFYAKSPVHVSFQTK